MDEKYFDAKFDGLEKLMTVQQTNLTQHINAVSSNVKRLDSDLDAHKESTAAHGLESSERNTSKIVSWLGLGLAAGLGIFEAFRSHAK